MEQARWEETYMVPQNDLLFHTVTLPVQTIYDIGGRIFYSVWGSDFSVPLLSDTIIVKANPSIVVHYLYKQYVQGNNPLTPEKKNYRVCLV
jgi:hypothetical protein